MQRDEAAGLPPASVEKIRRILTVLQEIEHPEELEAFPSWEAHRLTGDRKGTWSLTVTRNWRITFAIDLSDGEIVNLDYEDYH